MPNDYNARHGRPPEQKEAPAHRITIDIMTNGQVKVECKTLSLLGCAAYMAGFAASVLKGEQKKERDKIEVPDENTAGALLGT